MAQRYCCPECFDDRGLRDQLFPSLDPDHGSCDFCGTADVQLVEPSKLANYFELLVNVYEPSADGKSLVEWMKDDWQLFSHERMDVAHAKELLGEILDDGEIVRRAFAPSASYISEGLAQWVSCPLLSGPSTMTVWIEEGTTHASEEAQARGDHRQAA